MIPSEESGARFENPYNHPERWRRLWKQYFIGSMGTGIALGDVNGDGLPDIYAVGKDSPNALFLNLGDFRFKEVTREAGVAGQNGFGTGASLVDIDNDGDLDIYTGYVGSPNQLFLNSGNALFDEAAASFGLDLDIGTNTPAFADYDRDGDLDLYIQCNYMEGSGQFDGLPDFLYENRDGQFVDVTAAAGIEGNGQGHNALWFDYDHDGWVDLYIANDFIADDRLYRNNRDGTFTDVLSHSVDFAPYSAMGADFGDLNNDGRLDLFVAEMAPRDRAYTLRTTAPLSVRLMSLNPHGVGQYMQNTVAINIAPGRFADASFLTGMHATDWTWAPRLMDMDNDGRLDVFITNGMPRAFHDADIDRRVTRAQSLRAQVAIYQRSPPLEERNLAYRNLGDLQFRETSKDWGLDLPGVSYAAAFADFDQDGDMDLVVGNWRKPFTLYRNQSTLGHRLLIGLEGQESNRNGYGAILSLQQGHHRQVRQLAAMRGYMATDEPVAHFALPTNDPVDFIRIDWPSGKSQILENLLPGYRYLIREAENTPNAPQSSPTLFKPSMEIPEVSHRREKPFKAPRDQMLLPFPEDRLGAPLLVLDIDRDGFRDIVLGGTGDEAALLLKNSNGKRLLPDPRWNLSATIPGETLSLTALPIPEYDTPALFFGNGGVEFAQDDVAFFDLVYRFDAAGQAQLWDSANKAFSKTPTGPVAVIDLGGKHGKRLLVAGGGLPRAYPYAAKNRVYRITRDGLQPESSPFARAFAEIEKISDLLVVDLDDDGDADLVHSQQWGQPGIWLNNAGYLQQSGTQLPREVKKNGYWTSLATGDFNRDGKTDLLLGNLGLNSKYRITPERHYELLFNVDRSGGPRLFANVEVSQGKRYPLESRTLYYVFLPEEMQATGTYENYSRMTFEEAFPAWFRKKLDSRQLHETRSWILLQQADNSFAAHPLPHSAQWGQMIDIVAIDFDHDHDLDVVAALQPLSPQPWFALRPDRGNLIALRNNGKGTFETILPWQSGLIIETGQPKQLAVADLDNDGRDELIVSISDGPLKIFSTSPP